MADRKPFLLRIDRDALDAVQRWADDDLRSLNGQIEFLLRRVLQGNGREIKSRRALRNEGAEAKPMPSVLGVGVELDVASAPARA